MPLEGKQLSHYRIVRLVGSGGMGEVYLAEDTGVRRQVAIKLVRIEETQDNEQAISNTLRLFLREATVIANLDHHNILPLYDYGESVLDGARFAFLVTPYRPEGSMVNWLRKRAQGQRTRSLTLRQVAHLLKQAADALTYAHQRQVIHQDIKPANFLIRSQAENDEYPELLLADFGISRLGDVTASASQNVRGTPAYMAPEQWAAQSSFASDQYALAVMTYELLTGSLPFRGAPMNIMYAHLQNPPPPPGTLNPLLSPAVDAVLLKALAKKPEERFASVAAFAQAFQRAFQGVDQGTPLRLLSPSPATPNTPGERRSGDIYTTLAISKEEARAGAQRTLTLPNGQTMRVQIPPGSQTGQVLSLPMQGEGAGYVHLKLDIVEPQAQISPIAGNTAQTYRDPRFTPPPQVWQPDSPAQEPGIPSTPTHAQFGPPASPVTPQPAPKARLLLPAGDNYTPPSAQRNPQPTLPSSGSFNQPPTLAPLPAVTRRRFSPARVLWIVVVILLVFFTTSSLGLYYTSTGHWPWYVISGQAGINATATASTQNVTATAGAHNMTATAVQAIPTLTAVALQDATTTTQNPYLPGTGVLILNDDLQVDNGKWQTGTTSDAQAYCSFVNRAYQIAFIPGKYPIDGCALSNPSDLSFTNFTFQVQMKVVQGDGGGLAMAWSSTGFYFSVTSTGNWKIDLLLQNAPYTQTIASGTISGFLQGSPILLGGVGKNSQQIDLYINLLHIKTIDLAHPGSGRFALASGVTNGRASEVSFNYMRFWSL